MLGDECYGGKNKKGEEVYWDWEVYCLTEQVLLKSDM